MSIERVDHVEAVLKVTERCNINCSYCYMFNRGYDDYLNHPIRMDKDTIKAIATFLRDGAAELGARTVNVIIHGGEPLMMRKEDFSDMCATLRDHVEASGATMTLAMQTNAMLVSEAWVPVFSRHQIGVGVSIDGPKAVNDVYRVDHRGRGTYDRVVSGIKVLRRAAARDLISDIGALCVIDPRFDGRVIYRHLVHDLGIQLVDFLFPMESHDQPSTTPPEEFGRYLCNVFDEWVADADRNVRVRFIRRALAYFTRKHPNSLAQSQGDGHGNEGYALMSIASNGDIGPDDDFKVISFGQGTANVRDTTLKEFLSSPLMSYLRDAEQSIPDACADCCWQQFCRGQGGSGRLVSRYSRSNGFNNRTSQCSGVKDYFSHAAAYLVRNGFSFDTLADSLASEAEVHLLASEMEKHHHGRIARRPVFPIHDHKVQPTA